MPNPHNNPSTFKLPEHPDQFHLLLLPFAKMILQKSLIVYNMIPVK